MPAIFEKIDRIKPFYDLTYKVVLFVCKVLLVIDIAITSMAVAGRYIPFIPDPAWREEVVLTCMSYMAVLSAALAIRRGAHIRMTALDGYMPKWAVKALDIFADVPFFTDFTLRSALLLCYVGIFCAAFGFLLTAKITEYTSATEASFVYLIKPVLATLLAVVCFRETISVNRMIGLVFFLAASLCVSVPVLREMRRDAVTAQPTR